MAKEPSKVSKEDETLLAWLDCQRRGETGYEYWYEGMPPSSLFALTSYEIVAKNDIATTGGAKFEVGLRNKTTGDTVGGTIFTVRIHSSNAGGVPIVDLYRIIIDHSGKILFVETNDAWLERLEELEKHQ